MKKIKLCIAILILAAVALVMLFLFGLCVYFAFRDHFDAIKKIAITIAAVVVLAWSIKTVLESK